MDKQNGQLEKQNIQDGSKEKNNNLEIEKKLDILRRSELESFPGFKNFLSYISTQSDTKKLDIVIYILQSKKGKDKLLAYFNLDNEDGGKGFFKDETTYNNFHNNFIDIIKTISNNNQTQTVENQTQTVENQTQTVENQTQTVENQTQTVENNISIIIKELDIKGLEDIVFELNNKKTTDEKVNYLKDKKVQNKIFELLEKEARETHNPEKLEKITQSFFDLQIIDRSRYDELQGIIFNIKFPNKDPNKSSPEPITPIGYTQRGDTLYKSTDKTSFTIEDGKITSVSKDSGFKLTDYNTLDEDGKKLTEKMKLESEIKELTSILSENKDKKIVLDRIEAMINDVKVDNITDDNIKIAIVVIGSKFPLLNNQLLDIKNSSHNPKEKLEYIIRLIYGHITGSTNTFELNGLSLTEQIYITKNKLEIKDTEQNKELQEKQKKLEELKKLYPNLDEKSIQEKIKTQETKMQDTIKFCDEYGLSSLGHIAYIKQVIREYNKNEVKRKIPEDIGSSTEFLEAFKNDKDGSLTESLKKIMAKLVGKEVKDIFKDGNLGLNTIDRSTFDSDTGSAETINKNYLEKLLKEKGVLKKNSGELNIYKVQELLDD